MEKTVNKHWFMLTRYWKDFHGEPYVFVVKRKTALEAMGIIQQWTEKHNQEEDFNVFVHKIVLWSNIDCFDIDESSIMECQEQAKKDLALPFSKDYPDNITYEKS